MQPEMEKAIEDICNEAIVYDERRFPVDLVLDHASMTDDVKESVAKEFRYILRMLDFQNRGYEIFRRWYVDGKGYYHMIVDPKNVKKGIIEMRPVDASRIKKIAEVEKDTDPKTGAKTIKGVKEVYVYRDKPNEIKMESKFHLKRLIIFLQVFLMPQEQEPSLTYTKQSNRSIN